jgi:hypothetical protein
VNDVKAKWVWVLGVAAVLVVFSVCQILPDPLDVIIPTVFSVTLGGILANRSRQN